MHVLISIFLTILITAPVHASADISTDKAILVTGASSGIGRQIAFTLAEHGFYVYAGARKPKDLVDLSEHPNMQGVRLDVTVQSEIDAAVETIRSQGRGLYGLVNNAGVFLFDPLIEVSERDMQFIMDVNLFGPYRVTKAFAPLIIESKGRISTTGSVAGHFSGTLMGPYSMSKHAMEAFTESLSSEMAKFDVKVSIVEPGNFRSDIMKNMKRRNDANRGSQAGSQYEAEIKRFSSFTQQDRSHHQAPVPVAEAVLDFMTSEQPKLRYMVTPNQAEANLTLQRVLGRAIQLNQGQAHSLNLDQLTAVLTKLFAELHP